MTTLDHGAILGGTFDQMLLGVNLTKVSTMTHAEEGACHFGRLISQ